MAPSPERVTSVNKIGGKNMSQLPEVGKLVQYLEKQGEDAALVVSAFDGVTNALIAAMDELNGKDYREADIDRAFQKVREIHQAVLDRFFRDEGEDSPRKKAGGEYFEQYQQLRSVLMAHKSTSTILMPQEESYEIRDRIIGFGEKMAGKFLKIYLEQEGHGADFLDGVRIAPEDLNGGEVISNRKLHSAMRDAIRLTLQAREAKIGSGAQATRNKVIKILGGHVGGTPRGIAIDVGRSYSDTTAVNVALVMRELVGKMVARFWKDVDGVMTANPKDLGDDPDNQPLVHSKVDIREGLEAAAAGSLMMQVDALALAEEHQLDLRLQNIRNPELNQGTDFINMRCETGLPFKMIVPNDHIDSITVTMPPMANKAGFGAAFTVILDKYDISYDINPTGGTSMTFTIPVPQDASDREVFRRTRIQPALNEMKSLTVRGEKYEMREDPSWVEDARASISIIGNELKNQSGILARIAAVLGRHQIDIKAIAQDEKQGRVTFLIDNRRRIDAVRELHREFFGKKPA